MVTNFYEFIIPFKLLYIVLDPNQYQVVLFFLFLFISFFISLLLILIPQYLSKHYLDDKMKLASYECGFDPFGEARLQFDIQYYILGILFILFDIEVFFIFSWTIVLKFLVFSGFLTMIVFLVALMLGFIYEWRAGLLEWY